MPKIRGMLQETGLWGDPTWHAMQMLQPNDGDTRLHQKPWHPFRVGIDTALRRRLGRNGPLFGGQP